MSNTNLPGYPAHASAKQFITCDHTGPASYTTGGETLGTTNLQTGVSFQGLAGIDNILSTGTLSVSGNYWVLAQPTGSGSRKTWKLLWFGSPSGSGSGVSGVTITAAGTYTGTPPTVTFGAAPTGGTTATGVAQLNVAGTAVVGVLITNAGSGYASAPTVTFSTGGATGTAVLGAAGTGQVASATNLSAETVKLTVIG